MSDARVSRVVMAPRQGKGAAMSSWANVLARCAEASLRLGPGLGGSTKSMKSMKSRETVIRLKKFQVDERRRTVAQIESMISGFERISADLERDIKIEQDRSGIHDPAHFAYPTYAKAAIQRRDNLKRSAHDLKIQLEDAKAAFGEAFEEMRKVELLGKRDQIRERTEEDLPGPSERASSIMRRLRARGQDRD
jgi:flagellar protein FliJ